MIRRGRVYRYQIAAVTCGACLRTKAGRAATADFNPPPPPPPQPDPALQVTWRALEWGCEIEGRSVDGWTTWARPLNHGWYLHLHSMDPEGVSHFALDKEARPTPEDIAVKALALYAKVRANPENHSARRAAEFRNRTGMAPGDYQLRQHAKVSR